MVKCLYSKANNKTAAFPEGLTLSYIDWSKLLAGHCYRLGSLGYSVKARLLMRFAPLTASYAIATSKRVTYRFNLKRSVEQREGCVCGGTGQGCTHARRGIARYSKELQRRHKRAIHVVA
jgi:hypothetical protein